MRLPGHVLLLSTLLMPIAGCGAGSMGSSLFSPPNLSGNWQIQSAAGASTTSAPTAGLLLLGSLSSQGTAVTGTFRLANLSVPNSCGTPLQQIVTLSGTVDTLGNLSLTSAAFSGSVLTIQMLVPTVLTNFGAGTIAITGGSCTFASSPAIAVQIAPITGTYSGTVTASNVPTTPPITSGTVTLAVTQASPPNSDGQYAVTGTLQFAGGGCTNSTAVTGTVSGGSLTLASAPVPPINISQDRFMAVVTPTDTQLAGAFLSYALGPCNAGITSFASYTGTLNRQ